MSYREISDYYRQEHFDFYRGMASPFYAVTFELDVTRLKVWLGERQYPTYLNLCYFFTRAAQGVEDLRYRLREGRIVLYDRLHPGLTVPAPGGRFSFAYFDYDPDPDAFNRAAAPVLAERSAAVRLEERPERAWIYFSTLPKVRFTGLTHAIRDAADVEPRVSFGRFEERDGGLVLPVGLQVNHLFVDGSQVGELVERAQAELDAPGRATG